MADIRCPMCGQSNPGDLEVCQHCEARLTPLTGPLTDPDRALGTGTDESSGPKPTSSAADPAGEWLSGMRPADSLLDSEETDEDSWADEDPWDDLVEPASSGILDEDPVEIEPAPSSEKPTSEDADSFGELPNWLAEESASDFQLDSQPTSTGIPLSLPNIPDIPDAPDFDDEDELPSWLTAEPPNVGVVPGEDPLEVPEEVIEVDPSTVNPEDIPDWLTPEAASNAPDDLGWMRPADTEDQGELDEDDELEWLPSAKPAPIDDAPDLPEWTSDTELEQAPTLNTESPDWLAEIEERKEQSEIGTDSSPAFLGANLEPAADPLEDVLVIPLEIPNKELRDWLQSEQIETESAGDELEPDEDDVDLPDWLTESPQDEDDDETGSWLKSFTASAENAALSEASSTSAPESEEPLLDEAADEETANLGSKSSSDWMSKLEAIEGAHDESADELGGGGVFADPTDAFDDDDIDIDLGLAEESDDDTLAALGISGLALEAARPAEDLSLEEQMQAAIGSGNLEERDLPEWLKKMRPEGGEVAGQVAPEHREGSVERLGPLTGLRGLLSAEPDVTQAGTPPAYSTRLDVSDLQIERTRILERIIAEQVTGGALPDSGLISQQRVLRWLILAGLLFAVLVPLLLNTSFNPAPIMASLDDIPVETTGVNSLINTMGENAAVLLVFDYDAAFSGELEAASEAIVDHLMLNGSRIAVVSTSPTGPSLGERYIQQVQAGHDYQPGEQYVNLGYIAGGVSGLASFANSPYATTVVASHDRPIWQILAPDPVTSPWAQPAMVGIQNLSDFALTFVLADDPDVARGWIEQVQPALRPDSLVMIVSAQAEPLVRPYYPAQIEGLVAGLSGGRIYEHSIGRDASATTYWEPYGIAMFLVAILVLVGSIYNTYLFIEARDKESGA